jgi:Stress responsive A/B Barrel Domain
MLTHIVLFWLNENAPPNERESTLADCDELLKRVPTVREIHTGKPIGSSRPVVDSTYDIGLCVMFNDRAGHDVYQDHPLHQQFLAKHRQHWKKVVIYDFA